MHFSSISRAGVKPWRCFLFDKKYPCTWLEIVGQQISYRTSKDTAANYSNVIMVPLTQCELLCCTYLLVSTCHFILYKDCLMNYN